MQAARKWVSMHSAVHIKGSACTLSMIAYKIKGQHALRRLVLAAGKRVSMHSTCSACKSGLNSRYFQTLKKRVSTIDMTSLTIQAVCYSLYTDWFHFSQNVLCIMTTDVLLLNIPTSPYILEEVRSSRIQPAK